MSGEAAMIEGKCWVAVSPEVAVANGRVLMVVVSVKMPRAEMDVVLAEDCVSVASVSLEIVVETWGTEGMPSVLVKEAE